MVAVLATAAASTIAAVAPQASADSTSQGYTVGFGTHFDGSGPTTNEPVACSQTVQQDPNGRQLSGPPAGPSQKFSQYEHVDDVDLDDRSYTATASSTITGVASSTVTASHADLAFSVSASAHAASSDPAHGLCQEAVTTSVSYTADFVLGSPGWLVRNLSVAPHGGGVDVSGATLKQAGFFVTGSTVQTSTYYASAGPQDVNYLFTSEASSDGGHTPYEDDPPVVSFTASTTVHYAHLGASHDATSGDGTAGLSIGDAISCTAHSLRLHFTKPAKSAAISFGGKHLRTLHHVHTGRALVLHGIDPQGPSVALTARIATGGRTRTVRRSFYGCSA